MSRANISMTWQMELRKFLLGVTMSITGLSAVSCAADKQTASQENFNPFAGQTTSKNLSVRQECSSEKGCKLLITEVRQKPLTSDAEYNSRCQSLVAEQNKSQCSSPGSAISPISSYSSKPASTQCIFEAMNADGSRQTLKTIEIASGGSSIDVSALCPTTGTSKDGVQCKVEGNSCNGTVDIKIIDKEAKALSASQIAQICHAYIQPGSILPLKFSCSYGKSESSQTTVVSGTFAKIENNPTATTEVNNTPSSSTPQNPASSTGTNTSLTGK